MPLSLLIAIKRSKWERDVIHYGSEDAVKKLYQLQNDAFERVHSSHLRQIHSRELLQKALPEAVFVYREELPRTDFSKYNLIATLGGDNHFVHISQYINDIPVIGINSDTETSSGVLLNFTPETFIHKIKNGIELKKLSIDFWTGIEGELHFPDGEIIRTGRAISEISIRNNFPEHMSRYIISDGKNSEEQKCSGLLISTGTGSTGWFSNCVPESHHDNCTFAKGEDFFRFTAREKTGRKKYRLHYGEIKIHERLELISEMDGIICLDSDNRRLFNFPPGCRAIFKTGSKKLPVVKDINDHQ